MTAEEAELLKPKPVEKTVNCMHCGSKVPVSEVEQHIIDCQGGKATCGKCGKKIDAIGFMNHFKNCPGKLALTHEVNEEESEVIIQPQIDVLSPIMKELEPKVD
jgi:DNA-directed RNA polymerase subunit RPC12/RpoP